MVSYKTTRIIQRLFILAILIVASVGIFFVVQAVVDKSKNQTADAGKESLLKISNGYAVSMFVRGPIVSDEDFRSYKIIVSPSVRELNTYEGYKKNNLESIKLSNNVSAYEQFVYALNRVRFMDGSVGYDNKGACATGYVYEFETIKDEKTVKKIWSSSCGGSKSLSKSNLKSIVNLFYNQIKGGEPLIEELW